jgi:hypothetical protein
MATLLPSNEGGKLFAKLVHRFRFGGDFLAEGAAQAFP